jgi:hypothetical protein
VLSCFTSGLVLVTNAICEPLSFCLPSFQNDSNVGRAASCSAMSVCPGVCASPAEPEGGAKRSRSAGSRSSLSFPFPPLDA